MLDLVVADDVNLVSRFSERGKGTLQLDQLRLAPRSPVCASDEGDQCSPTIAMLMKVQRPSMLVGEAHVGEVAAHFGADVFEVDVGKRKPHAWELSSTASKSPSAALTSDGSS